MEKAVFSTKDKVLNVTIPIVKFDKSERTVSGFATLNNVDAIADVITAEASEEAFTIFRGNVREMHKDIAAGKVLDYKPEDFFYEGKVYSGIFVKVYISKGAPETWEKVLDGTLSGFSIKGDILECHSGYVAEEDKTVRFITKYRMTELSLVDSPCNNLCNILSIEKMDDGSTKLSGLAVDTKTENVFWCPADKLAIASVDELRKCSVCSSEMENIGWFESTDETPANVSILKVLQASNKIENNPDVTKGGSKMSENKEAVAEVIEKSAEAAEEKAPEVTEINEPDLASISKALTEIQNALSDSKANETIVAEIQKSVDEVKKDFDAKLDNLLTKHSKLEDEVKGFKEGLGSLEKALEAVSETFEKSTAIKKSSDVQSEATFEKNEQKSLWSGRFLPKDSYDQ